MATIDRLLEATHAPDETVLIVSKARRLPLERRRNAASLLPPCGLIHTAVTSRRVVFAPRRKFDDDVDEAVLVVRPIDEVERAWRPWPRMRNETLRVTFADGTDAAFELPSRERADMWLHALQVAIRDRHRWNALTDISGGGPRI